MYEASLTTTIRGVSIYCMVSYIHPDTSMNTCTDVGASKNIWLAIINVMNANGNNRCLGVKISRVKLADKHIIINAKP